MKVNGCGACSGFWKWLKPPHLNFFKEECNTHDILYDIGGDKYDRKLADFLLMVEMQKKTNNYFKNRKPISRAWYNIICYFYYLAVRIFGKKRFNYE